ncbi:MAG: SRPBCC family protein [Acidimicrobiales bacterium]
MTTGGSASTVIGADAARLWSMVTDVTRMGEWSPETARADWVDGASGPAVGARFKGQNRRGRTRWSTVCEVIEADPGRSFAFAVGGAKKPSTVWRYRFEPDAGGTRVTESFELVAPLGVFSRLLTRVTTGVTDRRADLEAGAAATLSALKARAEAGGA